MSFLKMRAEAAHGPCYAAGTIGVVKSASVGYSDKDGENPSVANGQWRVATDYWRLAIAEVQLTMMLICVVAASRTTAGIIRKREASGETSKMLS